MFKTIIVNNMKKYLIKYFEEKEADEAKEELQKLLGGMTVNERLFHRSGSLWPI